MRLVARLAAAVAASICSIASAGVIPPPWAGDTTNPQTQQLWTFSPNNPTQPDVFENPNGPPTLNPDGSMYEPINPFGPGTGGWLVGSGPTGPTVLDFIIPNYNQLFRKQIWIVIKFCLPPEGAGVPVVDIDGLDGSDGTQINTPTPSPVDGVPGMLQIAYLFEMPTCWTFLCRINVPVGIPGANTFIDQIYIATRCIIPAPGAAALIALGGLVGGRRRR